MKIYIAGPMTGLPDLNFPAFNMAAQILRGQGHTVVNPAELNGDPGLSWQECMRTDIRELVTCDSIVLLPNWIRSRGARLEFHIASELGIGAIEWTVWKSAYMGAGRIVAGDDVIIDGGPIVVSEVHNTWADVIRSTHAGAPK